VGAAAWKGPCFLYGDGRPPENWKNEFFLNLLAGGIRWIVGDANAHLNANLKQATPGYAEILQSFPHKSNFFPVRMTSRNDWELERSHGDRLVDPWLDVPARRVAVVREEGVDADDGLLRIPGVYFIFRLAILFRDGEDAQSLEGFERVGGFGWSMRTRTYR